MQRTEQLRPAPSLWASGVLADAVCRAPGDVTCVRHGRYTIHHDLNKFVPKCEVQYLQLSVVLLARQ